MIQISFAKIVHARHASLINNDLPHFSASFQQKIHRYRRWQDAQLSLLGRLLLQKAFQQNNLAFDDSQLQFTKYDKPFFPNSPLHFNISHSGEIVICAVSDQVPLGIDIEFMKPIDPLEFHSQMTPAERQRIINAENKLQAFYKYWTQKEAVIKAHGMGLSIPLKSFEVQEDQTQIDLERFQLLELQIDPDYCTFLAATKLEERIELREAEF